MPIQSAAMRQKKEFDKIASCPRTMLTIYDKSTVCCLPCTLGGSYCCCKALYEREAGRLVTKTQPWSEKYPLIALKALEHPEVGGFISPPSGAAVTRRRAEIAVASVPRQEEMDGPRVAAMASQGRANIKLDPALEDTYKALLQVGENETRRGSKAYLNDIEDGMLASFLLARPDPNSLKAHKNRSIRLEPALVERYRLILLQRKDELMKNGSKIQFVALFDAADKDGSKTITETEFVTMCRESVNASFGGKINKEEVTALFWHLDVNNSGTLSLQELKSFLVQDRAFDMKEVTLDPAHVEEYRQNLKEREAHLRNSAKNSKETGGNLVFKEADLDGDKLLDIGEFRGLCQAMALKFSERESMALFWHLDQDDSGTVSRPEFKKWLKAGFHALAASAHCNPVPS